MVYLYYWFLQYGKEAVVKTVKIAFDCGKAGTVTWDAPRELFRADMSNRQINRYTGEDLLEPVYIFFGLLNALIRASDTVTEQGIDEINSNLLAIAKRSAYRLGKEK